MPTLPTPKLLGTLDRFDLRLRIPVLVTCMMLAGVFPTIVLVYSHAMVYIMWSLLWASIFSYSLELPFARLLVPITPFATWMVIYAIWGTLAADYVIYDEALRFLFRFGSLATSMAIMVSSPRNLRVFANGAQWVLAVNLGVTLLLMLRPEYQTHPFFAKLAIETAGDRFAGLWRNANQAGLVSLLILALSHWASKWQAMLGRICGLSIIYLSASRTATWIFVSLFLLYLVFVASQRFRRNTLIAALLFCTVAFFAIKSSGSEPLEVISRNPTLARVLDVSESRTKEIGEGSRMDLLKEWIKKVPGEPWHGYGLFTLSGGDLNVSGIRPGFPDQGPHNLYLGIFLDVGILGLLSWLGLLAFQLNRIHRTRLQPNLRPVFFALCYILLVFSNFNHNMLSEYTGWMFYSLIFLLPASPAIRNQAIPWKARAFSERY